jgi:RimJ/RimL family protein N-acetyltransferase
MSVRIRQVRDEEVPSIRRWLDDPPFRSEFLAFGRDSDSRVSEKLGDIVHGTDEASYLAVERKKGSKLVGLLFSHKVPYFHYFEVGFYVIPEERNKGYGTDAMRLLLKHIFETQSVKTIVAGTSSYNIASQKALLRAGFKKVGTLKKTLFRNGSWEDSMIYQTDSDGFTAKKRSQGSPSGQSSS